MKLLLHTCCGPCTVYPAQQLKDKGIDFTGMYFNPNIHPIDEFEKRKENLKKLSAVMDFEVIYFEDFAQERWENGCFENIEGRCRMCYTLRFDRVAAEAANRGYDAFSTTLLVSPYQRHDMIKEICGVVAVKYGIKFYYEDFRSGYRDGQAKAKEYGLYRQKYCGCIKSKTYE